jgi:hypothetical protein
LFASAEYDENDKEADIIWDNVDAIMDSRRKDKREAILKKEIEKYRASTPIITEQFPDLKRKLYTLSTKEWDSIPDVGDYLLANKKRIFESSVPVPNTFHEKARQEKEHCESLVELGTCIFVLRMGRTVVAVADGRVTTILKFDTYKRKEVTNERQVKIFAAKECFVTISGDTDGNIMVKKIIEMIDAYDTFKYIKKV